jgi:hypothetical protein
MGSGLVTPQKPPGRRKAKKKQTGIGAADAGGFRVVTPPGPSELAAVPIVPNGRDEWASTNESVQAKRAISTGKLNTLLCFHTRPINVVVFHGS